MKEKTEIKKGNVISNKRTLFSMPFLNTRNGYVNSQYNSNFKNEQPSEVEKVQ
ncbi:MAG: hypothetical protein ACTHJ7_05095 [Candidatus Nitrosocosmicus sp.]